MKLAAKGLQDGPTKLPDRRTPRTSAWSEQKADAKINAETGGQAGASCRVAGRAMDAMGRSASKFPDRSERLERYVAGVRTACRVEAPAWRRLLVHGCRKRCALHDVRQVK